MKRGRPSQRAGSSASQRSVRSRRGGGGAASQQSSEDEYSQGSETQRQRAKWDNLSSEEREKLVGDTMRLILFMDHSKKVIRRTDINAKVLHEYKGQNLATAVIEEAQKRFKDIFGYELVEAPRVTAEAGGAPSRRGAPSASQSATTPGTYMLVNTLQPKEVEIIDWTDEAPPLALLSIILCIIHLNENVIDSETLSSHLAKLDLHTGRMHPILQDWERVVSTFVQETYLQRTKSNKTGQNGNLLYEYRMGPRAIAEIDLQSIIEIIATVFGEQVDAILMQDTLAARAAANEAEEEEEEEEEEGEEGEGEGA